MAGKWKMVSILGGWYQNFGHSTVDLVLLSSPTSSSGNLLTIKVGRWGHSSFFYYRAAIEQPLKEALPGSCPPDSEPIGQEHGEVESSAEQ